MNKAWNAATGNTPIDPQQNARSLVVVLILCVRLPAAKDFERMVNEAIARARIFLHAASARAKTNAENKRQDLDFEINDKVLLDSTNLKVAVASPFNAKPNIFGLLMSCRRLAKSHIDLCQESTLKPWVNIGSKK